MPNHRDVEKMRRLGEILKEFETDEEPSPAEYAARIAWANKMRAEIGMPPLKEEPDMDRPELEFYRIAESRGLRRSRR